MHQAEAAEPSNPCEHWTIKWESFILKPMDFWVEITMTEFSATLIWSQELDGQVFPSNLLCWFCGPWNLGQRSSPFLCSLGIYMSHPFHLYFHPLCPNNKMNLAWSISILVAKCHVSLLFWYLTVKSFGFDEMIFVSKNQSSKRVEYFTSIT